jgi:hypothetical protein
MPWSGPSLSMLAVMVHWHNVFGADVPAAACAQAEISRRTEEPLSSGYTPRRGSQSDAALILRGAQDDGIPRSRGPMEHSREKCPMIVSPM